MIDTLAFITSYRCTASCKYCCFECHNSDQDHLTHQVMNEWMHKMVTVFPLKVCVYTGGEPMLYVEDIECSIQAASHVGLVTRIVTNGYWASSREVAFRKLERLRNNGLNEINLSTGDYHAMYVPPQFIMNAMEAATDLGMTTLVNVVTSEVSGQFVSSFFSTFRRDFTLGKQDQITFLLSPCIVFPRDIEVETKSMVSDISGGSLPCRNILNAISLDSRREVGICCGLALNRVPWFKRRCEDIDDLPLLVQREFENPFHRYLSEFGPRRLLSHYLKRQSVVANIEEKVTHPCYYCFALSKVSGEDSGKLISDEELAELACIDALK